MTSAQSVVEPLRLAPEHGVEEANQSTHGRHFDFSRDRTSDLGLCIFMLASGAWGFLYSFMIEGKRNLESGSRISDERWLSGFCSTTFR